MSGADLEKLASLAAKAAVFETFMTLGLDIKNPIDVQNQFAFLRTLYSARMIVLTAFLGAIGSGGKCLYSGRNLLPWRRNGSLVGLHGGTEGDGGLSGAVVVKEHADDNHQDCRGDDAAGHDQRTAIFGGPLEAVGGGVDEFVVLESLAGLLIHWVSFPLWLAADSPL